uniref:NADH dehydrogenase subunit 4 n=1 Tax=Calliobdella nodulifera TaxID=3385569 RepID=UPI0020794A49|nr:NADH dehydrogenase subunit 4 [Notostomum cyclostomum]URP31061.1 NADH dehydrogenase subunit 4 [Notostomum cyclostomum]
MLKIMLPLLSLLYMKKMNFSWFNSINMLMVILLIFLSLLTSNTSLLMKTYWFMSDPMSNSLTMLTLWISSLMIIASNKLYMVSNKYTHFINIVLLLNIVLVMCFNMSSLIFFYFMFEISLIPTMTLIMIWGYQPERLKASFYLMLYTITASLPMLFMFIMLIKLCKSSVMMKYFIMMDMNMNNMLWILFLMGFLVKVPMYTTHLWLPKAHVEAPISGSMVLAAILLKLGGYGLIRLISVSAWMNKFLSPYIISLSLVGSIITSMICMRQHDLKSLIAYSSVSHMGLMICGLMTSLKLGYIGGVMIMIAHGLTSSALFILANINYDMMNSRSIMLSKNVLTFIPIMSMWWFLFSIVNMSAPPSINLMSEIMLNMSIIYKSFINFIPITFIMFFTGVYSLIMYTSLNHGNNNKYMKIYFNMSYMMKNLMLMHMIPIIMFIMKLEFIMY